MGKIDDLFAMKWMLPEQVALLQRHAYEKTLVTQTELEYDEIAEINYKLTDSKRYGMPLTVHYWSKVVRDLGEVESVRGVVGELDPIRREVRINEPDGSWTWVNVRRIVAVD